MAKLQIKDKNGNFLKLDDRKEKMAKGILIHNGSSTFKATKLAMGQGDNGSSYTFTDEYDYAIVSAFYGRDGHGNRGCYLTVSGCTSTLLGSTVGSFSDGSCQTGNATYLLTNPKKGVVCNARANESGSVAGISVIGITVGVV